MSLDVSWLTDRLQSSPNAIAFIDNDSKYTYGWILEQVPKFEDFLANQGIARGDVVVLVGDYSPAIFCFILASLRRGIILTPVTRTSVVEIDAILEVSEAKWLIEFDQDPAAMSVEHIDVEPINELTLQLRKQGQPGLLLFSSGSTGKPKGILLDFGKVLAKFRQQRPPIVAISFLMLDHFGGINTLLHITSCLGTVVTVTERSIDSICSAIEKHSVEVLPTTPSFLNLLVHSDPWASYDLGSLKVISYGTEVMPQSTLNRLRRMFPNARLQQTYGLSEVGVLRSQSRPDGSLWVKVGGEGFQTKVVDDVLWIKSDYAMLGYLNAPSPFDDEGWFNTQDRVEVDGDWLKILGRTTDIINVGGAKVYPSEVEDFVIGLDNILDVRVFGERNPLLGNIVVAEVKLHEPEDLRQLKKRVRSACAAELAPFKVPTKVTITEADLYSVRQKKVRSGTETP